VPDPAADRAAAAADDAELRAHVASALAATYELDREIGRGGMGIVYRARDKRLKRTVAIKLLPPELSFRRDIRSRFLREAETAAQLGHPNIVPIYSVDEIGNLVFFVMACVEGDNLAKQVQQRGPLPIDLVRRYLREVGEALAYAHARGVVHRDIKPDNILVDAVDGRALVTDFGIARAAMEGGGDAPRLTATGMAIGTPAYMSPEQASGDRDLDARSDLYSLGIVAYQMLTGEPPFTGGTTPALLVKHLTEPPVPVHLRRADVPPDLAAIVMRLLEKQPEHRFQSATELVEALRDGIVPAPRHGSTATGSVTFNGAPIGGMRIDGAGTVGEPSLPTWSQGGGGMPPLRDWPGRSMDERRRLLGEYQATEAVANAAAREAGAGWQPTPADLARWEAPPVADFRRKLAYYVFMGTPLLAIGLMVDRDISGLWTLWSVYIAYRYARLWSDGFDWRDALRQPRHRMFGEVVAAIGENIEAAFSKEKREQLKAQGRNGNPLEGALKPLPPGAALPAGVAAAGRTAGAPAAASAEPLPASAFGAWSGPVEQARVDQQEISRLLATLPAEDRQRIPDVASTAAALVRRVESLASDLARTDEPGGIRALADVEQEIAALEAQANPLDTAGSETRVRRLAQLRRERRVVTDAAARRQAQVAQLESCRIALENVRLDLVRLRTGSSSVQSVTLIAEQAMALAHEVDIAVQAAQEVRDVTRRPVAPAR
jgi:serine/threonine-protein kinase